MFSKTVQRSRVGAVQTRSDLRCNDVSNNIRKRLSFEGAYTGTIRSVGNSSSAPDYIVAVQKKTQILV